MGKMVGSVGMGTFMGRGIPDTLEEREISPYTGMERNPASWLWSRRPISYGKDSYEDSGQPSVDKDRPRAIITGAASGIGAACAVQIKNAGYDLLLVDKNEEALRNIAEALGSKYEVVDLSVQGPFVSRTPTVVVCAHGISASGRSWQEVIDVNLTGVQNVLAVGRPVPGGSVVLIGSMTGYVVGNRGFKDIGSYAASKAALVGLARQLAVEWAADSIRVNCVAPGPVQTPMTDTLKQRNPELYNEFFGRCLLPGKTVPKDIAHAVMFLIENPRITGQTVVVDGGYTIQ